ncbi:MAG: hypothetical protein JWP69_2103 [Flaviaesturariibacter sp.]|nr:hypothetical protein [Flaviaesturariibacter sp.]
MAADQSFHNLLLVCKALHVRSVQYMIVGGTAVAFYGYYRPSTTIDGKQLEKEDLDIWYNPSYENYFKLLDALEDLGQDVSRFREEKTPEPLRSFFRYEFDSFTLDFLPSIIGLDRFSMHYKQREISVVHDIEISIIGLADLLLSKKKSGRNKDIGDIEKLNKDQ